MADTLSFTAGPSSAIPVAHQFGCAVSALSGGSVNTSFVGTVILSLASNPGSATLGGTLSVSAVAGVAVFSGLSLGVVAQGYTLTASASGLTSATSGTINTYRKARWYPQLYRRHKGMSPAR